MNDAYLFTSQKWFKILVGVNAQYQMENWKHLENNKIIHKW
jgi:hypothetical protein